MNKNEISLLTGLINRRRSIRKYTPEIPPAGWIKSMIHCAARAPSPSNSRPVRFVRIISEKIREDINVAMEKGRKRFLEAVEGLEGQKKLKNRINAYFRFSQFMFDAPILFAVGTVLNRSGFSQRLFDAGILKRHDREDTDLDITVGLALKGFLLRGEELGLGACILTAPLVFIPDIEEVAGIKDISIKCFVTAGFPHEKPRFIERICADDILIEA